MTKLNKLLMSICIVLFIGMLFIDSSPLARSVWLDYKTSVTIDKNLKVRLKEVTTTCRALIASYKFDTILYEQSKNSSNKDEKVFAEAAKSRANSTVDSYNGYVQENMDVFKKGVPADIQIKLEYLE